MGSVFSKVADTIKYNFTQEGKKSHTYWLKKVTKI